MNKHNLHLWRSPFHSPGKVMYQAPLERKPSVCANRSRTQLQPDQNEVIRGSEAQTHTDSRDQPITDLPLSHAAVPFPPRLWYALHLVWCLPLLFSPFLFPSRLLTGAAVLQASQYGCVKHFLEIFLGQRGALHVGHGSNLHRTVPGVPRVHRTLSVFSQVDEDLKRVSVNHYTCPENYKKYT